VITDSRHNHFLWLITLCCYKPGSVST